MNQKSTKPVAKAFLLRREMRLDRRLNCYPEQKVDGGSDIFGGFSYCNAGNDKVMHESANWERSLG